MLYLKAEIDIEGCEHTLSFHRKMFIKPDVVEKLPRSITVKYCKKEPNFKNMQCQYLCDIQLNQKKIK